MLLHIVLCEDILYYMIKCFGPCSGILATRKVLEVEKSHFFLQERENAFPLILPPQSMDSRIVFDNVTFGYLPERKILNGLTLDVKAGEKTAIVGGSGSG